MSEDFDDDDEIEVTMDEYEDIVESEEEEIEDIGEDDSTEKITKLVGFKIICNKLVDILNHLKANGTTLSGEKSNFIDDCIIRVETNMIWSISMDLNKGLIASMRLKINNKYDHKLSIINTGEMPISIEKLLSYLNRFNSTDLIDVIYENGLIVIRKSRTDLNFPITVEAFVETTKIKNIRNDIITKLRKDYDIGKQQTDKDNLDYFKKYKIIGRFNKDKTIVQLYNGIKLTTYVELSCNQLKEVVRDGELHANRMYPFKVENNRLNITSKSTKTEDRGKVSRDMYIKQGNLNKNFEVTYAGQFNAAVSSTKGHVTIYFGDKTPLLLSKTSDLDYGLELNYIVGPQLHS